MLERFHETRLRSACAAVCFATLSTAGAASADGPLVPGEIVFATGYDGHIARVKPQPPFDMEVVTTEGNYSVAILNPQTIFVVKANAPAQTLTVNKIVLHIGQTQVTPVAQFAGSYADIEVDPTGMIVAVYTAAGGGGVLRIDPEGPPDQVPDPIVVETSSPYLIQPGFAMPSIEVGADGDIFVAVAQTGKLLRVEPGSLTEVWPGMSWSSALDIDRQSGKLVAMLDGHTLVKADPNAPFAPEFVFSSPPAGLYTLSQVALQADGQVVYQRSTYGPDRLRRANPADVPPVYEVLNADDWIMDIEILLPRCANGIDDNGNGLADFPSEPGCTSPNDPFEFECSVSFGSSSAPPGPAGLLLLVTLLWRRRKRE